MKFDTITTLKCIIVTFYYALSFAVFLVENYLNVWLQMILPSQNETAFCS